MPATQRRRRAVDEDSEDDARPRQRQNRNDSDVEAEEEGSEDETTMDDHSRSADDQLAKKLVRYAISCEFSRVPIRRDGVKERVLGPKHGRAFKRIYALAQKELREVWGMELRELPLREKMTLQEKRAAMKSNSQVKVGSNSYILSSTLPEAYRSAAILAPSKAPSADEEATYAAFYTMVVSMIWLNAGELSEQKLKRYLSRLNADQNVSAEKTEMILKKMEKQGYVAKKVDRPPVGQDGEHTITWHIGPRSKEEIGLDGVMGMVREVYGSWNEDLEKKLRSSLNIKHGALLDQVMEEEDADTSRAQAASYGDEE